MSDSIKVITKEQFDQAMDGNRHTYFFGTLGKPQAQFDCYPSQFELGMGVYAEYDAELPHVHTYNQEFNYVLEGAVKVVNLSTGEEHEFTEGSLFMYEPGTGHLSKNLPGTRTLFFKLPGGNDKEVIQATPRMEEWLAGWENVW